MTAVNAVHQDTETLYTGVCDEEYQYIIIIVVNAASAVYGVSWCTAFTAVTTCTDTRFYNNIDLQILHSYIRAGDTAFNSLLSLVLCILSSDIYSLHDR